MKNIHGDRITENMIVRLRKDQATERIRMVAKVIGWLAPDVPGGVSVSPPLERLSCWNIDALEPVPGRNSKTR